MSERAKVTESFPGRADNDTQVRQVLVGEIVSGDLARVAIEQGWAEEIEEDEETDIEKMALKQLVAFAKEQNIDLGEATKKADVLKKVRAAVKKAAS